MKKKILTGILLLTAALALSGCQKKQENLEDAQVLVEEILTQEFEFYSDDEHLILYNFPENIEENGKKYTITEDEVALETINTRETVQAVVDINVEDLEELPEDYQYVAPSGTTYDLKNEQVYIKEQGIVEIPVIEEVFYENELGKPEVPSKKTITYYDKQAGEDKEIEGLLTSLIESEAGHWEDILEIEGTFMAPDESCHEYELAGTNNVKVSRDAVTPTWAGYETQILSSLGVDGRYFRVTAAAWNGDSYHQDGWIMRNALFTGDIFVSTYKATYEAKREATGYAAKVFYRVDAEQVDAKEEDITTVYKIKAVVKYKLVN